MPAAIAGGARLRWPCALLACGFCFSFCGRETARRWRLIRALRTVHLCALYGCGRGRSIIEQRRSHDTLSKDFATWSHSTRSSTPDQETLSPFRVALALRALTPASPRSAIPVCSPRGFDSRLSVEDLLKATGASVIPLARPRSLGLTSTAGGGSGGPIAKAPMLSWFSSTATIPTGGFPSGAADAGGRGSGGDANGGASFRGELYPRCVAEDADDEQGRRQAREGDVFEPSAAAAAAAAAERMGVDLGIKPGTDITRRSSGGSSNDGGLLDGGGGGGSDATGASPGAGASGNPEVEARLRVISAAMHAVSAALSALSALPKSGGGGFQGGVTANSHGGGNLEGAAASAVVCDGNASLGDGAIMGVREPDANDCGGQAQSHNGSVASASAVAVAAASVPPHSARDDASVEAKNDGPQHSRAESVVVDQASPKSSKGEEAMRQGSGVSRAVAAPEVGGAGAAAAAVYGRELARAAGTPTVDAIGGDVHLVATVAGKRSLTRLLHFVDLVRAGGGKNGDSNVRYVGAQRQVLEIGRMTAS